VNIDIRGDVINFPPEAGSLQKTGKFGENRALSDSKKSNLFF